MKNDGSDRDKRPGADSGDIDVHAVLSAVLDKPPPADMADRVLSRVALLDTAMEFAKLFCMGPVNVASESMISDPDEDPQNTATDETSDEDNHDK